MLRRSRSAVAGATLGLAVAIFTSGLLTTDASAQGVSHANYDMEASGFVTPAGMPPVSPAAMTAMGMGGSPVMPVGFNGPGGFNDPSGFNGYGDPGGFSGYGCDSGACDGMGMGMQPCVDRMQCGTCGGGGGCSCNDRGGVLGKLKSNGMPCLFCRGSGCTACRATPFGHLGGMCASLCGLLMPYDEASLCNQRWYDISIEAISLRRDIGGGIPDVVTTLGVAGTPALTLSDIGDDDFEAGARISAAMIWGVGGNLEMTYIGGNKWNGAGSVSSSNGDLYSYISDYGTFPPGAPGYDDTDRSISQSLQSQNELHSVELNYRRRTMFPYCRFQSSWLLGLRFIRYDDALSYSANGMPGIGFYNSYAATKNKLFGPQAGFDFWWNVIPGFSLGWGAKAAWMQNDVDRSALIVSNSLGPNEFQDGGQKGSLMGEFEMKMVYRFTYSCSLRTSYFAMAADNVAFGGLGATSARNFVTSAGSAQLPLAYDDLVVQGITGGIEYRW